MKAWPYSANLATVSIDRLYLLREDPVHDLGAGGDYGAQFAAVDQLGGTGLPMAGEAGDLLDGDAACGHDAHESVPQLPGHPLVT